MIINATHPDDRIFPSPRVSTQKTAFQLPRNSTTLAHAAIAFGMALTVLFDASVDRGWAKALMSQPYRFCLIPSDVTSNHLLTAFSGGDDAGLLGNPLHAKWRLPGESFPFSLQFRATCRNRLIQTNSTAP